MRLPEEHLGKSLRCPRCKNVFRAEDPEIPSVDPVDEEPPAAFGGSAFPGARFIVLSSWSSNDSNSRLTLA